MARGGRAFFLDHIFARGLAPTDTAVLVDHEASDHDALRATLTRTH